MDISINTLKCTHPHQIPLAKIRSIHLYQSRTHITLKNYSVNPRLSNFDCIKSVWIHLLPKRTCNNIARAFPQSEFWYTKYRSGFMVHILKWLMNTYMWKISRRISLRKLCMFVLTYYPGSHSDPIFNYPSAVQFCARDALSQTSSLCECLHLTDYLTVIG